jgi:tryptophan-associated transmembrane protein
MKFGRGYAVAAAVVGAGLALFAASRAWKHGDAPMVGLPARARTGGDLVPWLPALALAGLAGAGAVLAAHGLVRRTVGGLLALFGIVIAGAGVYGLTAGGSVPWAPAVTVVGGLLVGAAGVLTVIYGGTWPGMAARYQRSRAEAEVQQAAPAEETGDTDDAGGRHGAAPAPGTPASVAMWDALDRGEDPTQ